MKNIVLFASGNGSNAANICAYFKEHKHIRVAALFCNKPDAKVIGRMQPYDVPVHVFNKEQFANQQFFLPLISQYEPSLVVLAGFLWLVPAYLVQHYPGRIINIHPALLPAYGGKGMHGHHVHEAVLARGEKVHGITIHYVNEHFDEGEVIFSKSFELDAKDDMESVAAKIASLEMKYFPEIIEKLLS